MGTKIQYFPITAYSITMGLLGFTIVLNRFAQLHWIHSCFFSIFLWLSVILFLTISIFYGIKFIIYPDEVKFDFSHKILINFLPTISISLLLLSIALQNNFAIVAKLLWWIGTILHTFFLFKIFSFWIQHSFEIQHFNPAWFIPIVGSIIIPIAGSRYVPALISYFYFSIGFFFWVILFTIFLYRAIFHPQLPEKFIPTFFILMAPPAVGFLSYIQMTGRWDLFSSFLLFINYFIILLLISLYKSFSRLKFNMSWWAFTFPLAASTLASVTAYQITQIPFFQLIAKFLAIITFISILIVGSYTFIFVRQGKICVKEN